MSFLEFIDVRLFRLLNDGLNLPALDGLLGILGRTGVGVAVLLAVVGWLVWRGERRGLWAACALSLCLVTGEMVVTKPLKNWIQRPRPYRVLEGVHRLGGTGGGFGMPSSHAFNSFLAAAVVACYLPRLRRWGYGFAGLVALSRVQAGVHYPSDLVVGAGLGVLYGWLSVGLLRWVWRRWGGVVFPTWHGAPGRVDGRGGDSGAGLDEGVRDWLGLSWLLILGLMVLRWWYLSSGAIELSEDEVYQWLWSKHPALSYYSKPPLISWVHMVGTGLWGDTVFGIRFFAPVTAALLSVIWVRFLAREVSPFWGFALLVAAIGTPLLGLGSILMTIDPLNVLFWSAALISGWAAVSSGRMVHWIWTGVWMGLGSLSKYTALFQWLGFLIYFAVHPASRVRLKQAGLWVALGLNLVFLSPVLVWNAAHGWVTVTHLGQRGGLDQKWKPTLRFLLDFVGAEPMILNPVFFGWMVWAGWRVWTLKQRRPLGLFLFSMGVPLFLFYAGYTLRARVLPNWIAPSVLPMLAMTVVCLAEASWELRRRSFRTGLWASGVAVVLLVFAHDTNLLGKVFGLRLPLVVEPLKRLRGWEEMARVVGVERDALEGESGRTTFVIGEHYGTTSLLSFYLPEAKAGVPDHPMVYFHSSEVPLNQFFFWEGYRGRVGQNAVFVQQVPVPEGPPAEVVREFERVEDRGMRDVRYRDRVLKRVQLFACYGLKPGTSVRSGGAR